MKAFKCLKCEKICYSSADLDVQVRPECPYCGADIENQSEVDIPEVDTNEER